ncbi:hypothetical protein H1R20_g7666, partial [Candolleomyces eurysporus]
MTVPERQTDTAHHAYSVYSAHPRSTKPQDALTESEGVLALGESQPSHGNPGDSHIAARGPITSKALETQPLNAEASTTKQNASPTRQSPENAEASTTLRDASPRRQSPDNAEASTTRRNAHTRQSPKNAEVSTTERNAPPTCQSSENAEISTTKQNASPQPGDVVLLYVLPLFLKA